MSLERIKKSSTIGCLPAWLTRLLAFSFVATDVQRDAVGVEICSEVFCFKATTNSPSNVFKMLANVHLRPSIARSATRKHFPQYLMLK
jgi:hypothetical protein